MNTDIGNYAQHAQYWDWGGFDRTPEHEHWLKYAEKYGRRVLIPMCALGETGAYMAERGFEVTAFDLTPEMISEGKKRFGHIGGLTLLEGDVRDFSFDIPRADFAFSMDFGHLHSLDDVKRAIGSIARHLRVGGCFVLETDLQLSGEISYESSERTFEPFSQIYPDIRVWKKGSGRYDAVTGRQYIAQTFYAQHADGHIDSFEHEFYLQNYTRDEWLSAFSESGLEIIGEYNTRELSSWLSSGDGFRVFETIKRV